MKLPDIVLAFLVRQAETIRKNLYFMAAAPFRGSEFWPGMGSEEITRQVLHEEQGMRGFQRLLFVIAVLDYQLERPHDSWERAIETLPEELKTNPLVVNMHLQAPLRRKYFDAALAEWKELRRTCLGIQALREYELELMLNMPPELPQDRADTAQSEPQIGPGQTTSGSE